MKERERREMWGEVKKKKGGRERKEVEREKRG